ncbi:hypothetical protein ACJROX_16740 [Pseudalkalibacillus sp. A8]|uniref:hypothetical protein n=1 Tax=Pseudalkalibacillus sp. A8 TaxID=3382641 RepID=UPI0038B62596
MFRTIEMKKGKVNVTFGYGKRPSFDHIGFLITKDEHDAICDRASKMDWGVKIGERRTFLLSPYGFSIELQTHEDVIYQRNDTSSIQKMRISTNRNGLKTI